MRMCSLDGVRSPRKMASFPLCAGKGFLVPVFDLQDAWTVMESMRRASDRTSKPRDDLAENKPRHNNEQPPPLPGPSLFCGFAQKAAETSRRCRGDPLVCRPQ